MTAGLFLLQDGQLENWNLARLAQTISADKLEAIAVEFLGFSRPQINDITSSARQDVFSFKHEILIRWKAKNHGKNSKQVC